MGTKVTIGPDLPTDLVAGGSQSVNAGPTLPEGLQVLRIDTNAPETEEPVVEAPTSLPDNVVEVRPDGTYVVRTTDINGFTIDTVMGVAKKMTETKEQLAARVKTRYIDTNGFTVETY